jgi:hypothetical protein
VPRSLEGSGQPPLMLGARPRLPPRLNAAAIRKVSPELHGILVVDGLRFLHTEGANLPPSEVAATPLSGRRTRALRAGGPSCRLALLLSRSYWRSHRLRPWLALFGFRRLRTRRRLALAGCPSLRTRRRSALAGLPGLRTRRRLALAGFPSVRARFRYGFFLRRHRRFRFVFSFVLVQPSFTSRSLQGDFFGLHGPGVLFR